MINNLIHNSMGENKHVHLLMKFGKKEYLERFLGGEVYLNTVHYFREMEKENKEIGDELEGTTVLLNMGKGTVQSGSMSFNFDNFNITQADYLNQNLFCLSCLEDGKAKELMKEDNIVKIDTTVFNGFTNQKPAYCVAITDCKNFYQMMENALKEKKLDYKTGIVEYFDTNAFSGKWDLFKKPIAYSYQREFRFVVNNSCDKPLILNIGSIENMAKLISPNQTLKLTFQETTAHIA